MRLLGLAPTRTRDPEDDDEPEEPPSGERWGMTWDPEGEGEWRTPDGRPAMPGRDLAVVPTPGGPARCLETAPMAEAWPDMIPGFDAMATDHLHHFNRLAYPQGGLQWDPRTRTLWYWHAPGGGASVQAAVPAGARAATPAAAPVTKLVDDLRGRLDRLLASTAAVGPEDEDLAEAVCSVLWPNCPPTAATSTSGACATSSPARPSSPPTSPGSAVSQRWGRVTGRRSTGVGRPNAERTQSFPSRASRSLP